MPISHGTYRIRTSGGGDYTSLGAALSDIDAGGLDGDLTLQVEIAFETVSTGITRELNGYRLRIVGVPGHCGIFGGGAFMVMQGTSAISMDLTGGIVEVDSLGFSIQSATLPFILGISATGCIVEIHDVIVYNGISTGDEIQIALDGGSELRMWNSVLSISGIGTVYALKITLNSTAELATVENVTIDLYGALNGISVIGTMGKTVLRNVAVFIDSPTTGVCYSAQTPALHEQHHCASSDSTAGIFGTVTGAVTGMNPSTEFVSTDGSKITGYSPKVGSQLVTGGAAATLLGNTRDTHYRERPWSGDTPSIGAVEGTYSAVAQGDYTVGEGGDFGNWTVAFAAVKDSASITGNISLTQISDITDYGSPSLPKDLLTKTLRITSASPHGGNPNSGYRSVFHSPTTLFVINVTNGTLIVEYLSISSDMPNWKLPNVTLGGSNSVGNIHDLLIYGRDTSLAGGDGLNVNVAGSGTVLNMWNIVIRVRTGSIQWNRLAWLRVGTSATLNVENCTFYRYATQVGGTAGTVYIQNTDGTGILNFRNIAALSEGAASYGFEVPSSTGMTFRYCACTDTSLSTLGSTNYLNVVVADEFRTFSLDARLAYAVPLMSGQLDDGGEIPQIAENILGINGYSRTSSSAVGASEPVPVVSDSLSSYISDLDATSPPEGPQILVEWTNPTDPCTTHLKLIRKVLNYPESVTDGIELLSVQTGMAPDHYVDLNVATNRAICYVMFIRHFCTRFWGPKALKRAGTTVIPYIDNGYFYECKLSGVTGDTEPTWPTIVGSTVADGECIWECVGFNPSWVPSDRDASVTWDSEYMQNRLWALAPDIYKNADAESNLVALSPSQDPDDHGVWRAIHEDGTVKKGEFQRFLMLFGTMLSRMKGAVDFYPKMVDPDECLPQYLPYLASIVGWALNTSLPTAQQRQAIMSAVPTYRRKGTGDGLETLLRSASGVEDIIIDPMSHHILMSTREDRLSARGGRTSTIDTWQDTTAYARGDTIVPVSIHCTGYYYQARRSGTSGASEPSWPTVPGSDVADGGVTWRCRRYGQPHLIGDVLSGATVLLLDGTEEFEAGRTINIRDEVTPAGEQVVIASVDDEHTLTLATPLENKYLRADSAIVTFAFDWHDDKTGFIWDMPTIDSYGNITDPSELYSFEFLRVWFELMAGESITNVELAEIAKVMEQFAPSDISYATRIEGP